MFSPVTTSASKECVDLNNAWDNISDDEESNEEDEATIQSEDANEELPPTEEGLDKKSLNSDEVNAPCEYIIEKKRKYISKYGKQAPWQTRYQNKEGKQ